VLAVVCFWEIEKPSVHLGLLSNSWLVHPQGIVAEKERALLVTVVLLMLVVAVPVYYILFYFAWKYRADRPEEKYSPNLQRNAAVSVVLWAIPIALIATIGALNWKSTHALDPSVPIASNVPPLTVQVVALQWKFLFIYPQQNIATVNFIEFPENTPVHFELTADAPMSSFWIPQLGSQIYAMAAMSTQLNLMASSTGDFPGMDTEINGAGFSGMKFIARSATQADFNAWVAQVKSSSSPLDANTYATLSQPSQNNAAATYSSAEGDLYDTVLMKYMGPMSSGAPAGGVGMPGMNMDMK
jgi:cytochrome o ubiquinol oxidase subunit 2